MFPYIKLGPLTLGSYGVLIVIGFALGVFVAVMRRKLYGLETEDILYAMLFAGIGIGVGGKLLFLLTALPDLIQNAGEIFSSPEQLMGYLVGGFVFYGGLFGGLLGAFLYTRRYGISFAKFCNTAIVSVPLIHAFGRLGCFCAGCCYGVPADPPLGLYFNNSPVAPHGVALFPVQLLEAGLNLLLFFVLALVFRKRRRLSPVPVYLISYAVIRFVLEYFRYDAVRGIFFGLSTSQWISVALALGTGLFLFVRRRKMA